MITYNDIYEAARKERYSEQLQPISKKFVKDVSTYLKEKKEATDKNENLFSESIIKTKKQLENAVTLFRELMFRRKKKILNLVLIAAETGISKQDFENMLDFEKELFEEIMKCVERSEKKLSQELIDPETKKEKRNQLIIFLEEVTEFQTSTGKKMGPFKRKEIANIPSELAKIFIEDKKARYIEEI